MLLQHFLNEFLHVFAMCKAPGTCGYLLPFLAARSMEAATPHLDLDLEARFLAYDFLDVV